MFLIFCYSSAKTVKTSVNGRTHAYLFDSTRMTGHGKERTHKETLEHAQMANSLLLQDKQTPIFGVEGTTWFIYVSGFDIIRGVALHFVGSYDDAP